MHTFSLFTLLSTSSLALAQLGDFGTAFGPLSANTALAEAIDGAVAQTAVQSELLAQTTITDEAAMVQTDVAIIEGAVTGSMHDAVVSAFAPIVTQTAAIEAGHSAAVSGMGMSSSHNAAPAPTGAMGAGMMLGAVAAVVMAL